MKKEEKNSAILRGLCNVLTDSKVLYVYTPMAWLIYVEISPTHYYYIAVEKTKAA